MTATDGRYMSKIEACGVLCVSHHSINKMIREGTLSSYEPPRGHPKLIRSEVEQLARKSMKTATAGA